MTNQIIERDGKFWKRMLFKKNKVWVASNPDGKPLVENGKSLIRYQPDQEYQYLVLTKNLRPLDAKSSDRNEKEGVKSSSSKRSASSPSPGKTEPFVSPDTADTEEAICIYTDGASSGNPGPSGIGVLMRFKGHEKEISESIGIATNNIAELEAIRVALSQVKKKELPVRVFTDSGYAYGLLVQGWKAKKNEELVAEIRRMLPLFRDLKFVKVRGHAGQEGNERADFLATSAIGKSENPKK